VPRTFALDLVTFFPVKKQSFGCKSKPLHGYPEWSSEQIYEIPAEEIVDSRRIVGFPTVSVLLLTRNHESFIREAIESILAQRTDFPFEIIIGDDCSSDQTTTICKEFQKQYPDTIRLITANKRVGITANFLRIAIRASSPYLAFLEGDDYWISRLKLSKQVELMINNPAYSWCGAKTLNRIHPYSPRDRYSLSEVCRRFVMHTSTIVFRRNALFPYPYFPDMVGWISMVCVVLSTRGDCGFLNEELSYYRRHHGGVYTGSTRMNRIMLAQAFTDIIDRYLSGQYRTELYAREIWICDWESRLDPYSFNLCDWGLYLTRLIKIQGFRGARHSPLKFSLLLLKILVQPLQYLYFVERANHVKLGKR
jgi:glycosyltransferase involved in cell wall biosynthesis